MPFLFPKLDDIDATDSLYGADPTGQRDSTTAIRKALEAADALGVDVRFPPGAYRIDQIALQALIQQYGHISLKGEEPKAAPPPPVVLDNPHIRLTIWFKNPNEDPNAGTSQ
jgi:hypothetical protein